MKKVIEFWGIYYPSNFGIFVIPVFGYPVVHGKQVRGDFCWDLGALYTFSFHSLEAKKIGSFEPKKYK